MAITVQQANAHSTRYFGKRFTENVYRRSTLLKLLRERKRIIPGGTEQQFPVDFRELGSTASRHPRSAVTFRSQDTDTAVVTSWAYYNTTNIIHVDEIVQNVGKQAIVRTIARKAEQMSKDMGTKMARDLYKKSLIGRPLNPLTDIISAAAFGGIDEETFRANVYNWTDLKMYGGKTDGLSYAINHSLLDGDKVSHIFLSNDDHSKIEEQWVAQTARREMPQSKETIRLGFDSFTFKGVDFIADEFIDEAELTGQLFGIEIGSLLLYESGEGTKTGKWMDATLANFPDAMIRVASWTGQLTATRRRTMFLIKGITNYSFN